MTRTAEHRSDPERRSVVQPGRQLTNGFRPPPPPPPARGESGAADRTARVPTLRHLAVQTVAFWIRAVEDLSALPFRPFGAWLLEEVTNPTHRASLESLQRSTYLTPEILGRFFRAYFGDRGGGGAAPPDCPPSFGALWLRGVTLTQPRVRCLRSIAAFITHLDVAGVREIDDVVCAAVLAHLGSARTLVLANTGITNLGLAHMVRPAGSGGRGLSALKYLCLRSGSGANEDAAGMILERVHGFRKLAPVDPCLVSSAAEAEPTTRWFDSPFCDVDDDVITINTPAMWGNRCEKWSGSGLWRMLMESDIDVNPMHPACVWDAESTFWRSLEASSRLSAVRSCRNFPKQDPPLIYHRDLNVPTVEQQHADAVSRPPVEPFRGKKPGKRTSTGVDAAVLLQKRQRATEEPLLVEEALRMYQSDLPSLRNGQSPRYAVPTHRKSLFGALQEPG